MYAVVRYVGYVTCLFPSDAEVGPGAFLAAAFWGGQWGGHIFIWGGARILDDIMHD